MGHGADEVTGSGPDPPWLRVPRTHSACTARPCSSWSPAGSRCSRGLRSGAGAPCTLGCASGRTQCCRLTTCSTPSRPRPLQEQATLGYGQHRHSGAPHAPRGGKGECKPQAGHSENPPMSTQPRASKWSQGPGGQQNTQTQRTAPHRHPDPQPQGEQPDTKDSGQTGTGDGGRDRQQDGAPRT